MVLSIRFPAFLFQKRICRYVVARVFDRWHCLLFGLDVFITDILPLPALILPVPETLGVDVESNIGTECAGKDDANEGPVLPDDGVVD